jgi:predicted RNA-binding Zn-ribbon protein involved in translation (DUF1610 family)
MPLSRIERQGLIRDIEYNKRRQREIKQEKERLICLGHCPECGSDRLNQKAIKKFLIFYQDKTLYSCPDCGFSEVITNQGCPL